MDKETLKELITRNIEDENTDFKADFNWDEYNKSEKCEIVKDILAFANTRNGGHIIIGVAEDENKSRRTPIGVKNEHLKGFESANINNFVKNYTDPKHTLNTETIELYGNKFVIINIPEFTEDPIICKKACDCVITEGQIFIRVGDKSEPVSSANEMREILGRALTKKGDKLLRDIEIMIKGRPYEIEIDAQKEFNKEIDMAKSRLNSFLAKYKKENGSIQLIVTPDKYNKDLISEHSNLLNLIKESQITRRGWYFPHIESPSTTNEGIIEFTEFMEAKECYYAFKSGLFVFEKLYKEDFRDDKNSKAIGFKSLLYQVTEYLDFIKKYYSNFDDLSSIKIELNLFDTENRSLSNLYNDAEYHWYKDSVCTEDKILVSKTVSIPDLKASWDNIAWDFYIQICALFNFNMTRNDKINVREIQYKFLNK